MLKVVLLVLKRGLVNVAMSPEVHNPIEPCANVRFRFI